MIYHYVKRYLKTKYNEPKVDFQWKYMDSLEFLEYIDKRYTMQEFKKELPDVKEAFRDFFENIGTILFRFTDSEEVKLKVFPYRIKPENSIHLSKIIKIIKQNRKYIKYRYHNKDHQIAILGKIRRRINIEIFDSKESVNKNDLIKYAIRKALELDDMDVVVKLKRKFIIKIAKKHQEKCKELEKNGEEEGTLLNRFNGYNEDDVKKIYVSIFEKKDANNIESFLQKVMQNLFKKELNFREIDNKYYEANVLKIIQSAIAKELTDYISVEHDFLLGITGFLMRKHFYYIHELMAIELIECIYAKNTNANKFLLFYNGNIVVKNGKKYQIPSLETEDGNQWNNSSLIGICNLWMNIKNKHERVEFRLKEIELKIEELHESLSFVEEEKNTQEEIIKKTKPLVENKLKVYQEIKAKLKYLENTSMNSDHYFAVYEKTQEVESELREAEKIISAATEKVEIIKSTNILTFTELETLTNQRKQLLLDSKFQELNINSKDSQMKPIIKSIVNVLMSRQKIVD